MNHSPIVVIGAGYVGKRLLQRLDGSENIGLGRSSSLNLDSDLALPVMLPDIFCLLYTVPPSPDEEHDVRLLRFLDMLKQVPQRCAYISTTGVYGDHRGALVDEESALLATSERAKRRLSAESILLSLAQQTGYSFALTPTPVRAQYSTEFKPIKARSTASP